MSMCLNFRCEDAANHKDFRSACGAALIQYDSTQCAMVVLVSISQNFDNNEWIDYNFLLNIN